MPRIPAALRAVGAADFDHAIVAISDGVEASIFATMALKELGVGNVITKAGSRLHGAILEKAGADRVVFPEREMGLRVAHSFSVRDVMDYLDVAPEFGIVKVRPPASFVGRTFGTWRWSRRLGLTPMALRRGDEVTVNPPPETHDPGRRRADPRRPRRPAGAARALAPGGRSPGAGRPGRYPAARCVPRLRPSSRPSPRRASVGNFRWLFGESLITNIGDGVALAAGPLLVASQTRDPLLVSFAVLSQTSRS